MAFINFAANDADNCHWLSFVKGKSHHVSFGFFFSLNVLISNPQSHFVLCCIPLLHADKMSNCQLLKQQQFWQKQKQERCKYTGIHSLPF